jgi:hypothetical protein
MVLLGMPHSNLVDLHLVAHEEEVVAPATLRAMAVVPAALELQASTPQRVEHQQARYQVYRKSAARVSRVNLGGSTINYRSECNHSPK